MPAPDLSDPLTVAVEITEIKGALKLLQEQISTGMRNITKAIDNIQSEQRQTTQVMIEVARQQQTSEATSQGLSRAFNAIERLAQEFSDWRAIHEKENKDTAEHVTTFRGALRGLGIAIAILSMMGGGVLALALYSYRQDLNGVEQDIVQLETKHDKENAANRIRIERLEQLKALR